MRVTFLIDNTAKDEALVHEWGLAAYIEYEGKNILLDTGASGAFAKNAPKLGVDLSTVNLGVLSHAHYDHADGLPAFFAVNDHAPFYLQSAAGENCYDKRFIFKKYIGIRKGTLAQYKDRIEFADGKRELSSGVWLLPHTTPGLENIGKAAHMVVKHGARCDYDSFAHEQSLVFLTEKGLVIFNSCSHGGADNIVNEAAAAFPNENLYALIGGFHLFLTPEDKVRAFAERLAATPVERVLTGHCTGGRAYKLLKESLGDRLGRFYTGLSITL